MNALKVSKGLVGDNQEVNVLIGLVGCKKWAKQVVNKLVGRLV